MNQTVMEIVLDKYIRTHAKQILIPEVDDVDTLKALKKVITWDYMEVFSTENIRKIAEYADVVIKGEFLTENTVCEKFNLIIGILPEGKEEPYMRKSIEKLSENGQILFLATELKIPQNEIFHIQNAIRNVYQKQNKAYSWYRITLK